MSSLETRFSAYCTGLDANRRRVLPPVAPVGTPSLVADFSHNDYLGLAQDPKMIEAACAAARQHGVGATGSRLLSGNLAPHVALETSIARAKGCEAALIFNSGYQANASALAVLLDARVLGAEPLVFSDRLNHASLHHACQLMNVRQQRYRHNDLQHLRELLETSKDDPRPRFIVTETVFGMDGDVLDMAAIAALADQYDAFLYLDEAHATGVMGRDGYGVAAGHMQRHTAGFVADSADADNGSHLKKVTDPAEGTGMTSRGVVMGTFSKGLGAAGAYVACSNAVRDYLVNRCTGFIYSTAPSPMLIGAIQTAWDRLPHMQSERINLMARAQDLRVRLQAAGFDTGKSTTHIVPIIIGSEATTLALKAWLATQGILVSAIRPPTVPPNTARLRIALSTAHTAEQIDALLAALLAWRAQA